jgi:DNA polymerase-3 subunit delta'
MNWEAIAGHAGVKQILRNMVASDRVPHALLFTGPVGLGKMLTARVLASALLCSAEADAKPCGFCPACRQMQQGSHPDATILANDGGASLKIDQMRALQHDVALTPLAGQRRVVIIEDADRLTTQAANSLLKTLEEPPAGTVFILTALSPYALLPTIVSRCRLLAFRPLPYVELADLLVARGHAATAAAVAARLAAGRVGVALQLLAPGGLALRDTAADIIAALPSQGANLAWDTAAPADKLAPAQVLVLCQYLTYILRDLMVIISGQEDLVLNLDLAGKLKIMAAAWDEGRLRRALTAVRQAGRALDTNAGARLIWEALLLKLADAVKEGTIFADSRGYKV